MSDKTGLRVLVCGGRDFHERQRVWDFLDQIAGERGPITVVMQGGASGADHHALTWAMAHKINVESFKADWRNLSHPDAVIVERGDLKYDALAGFRRNQRMLDEGKPDLVIGFPGGTGTADMLTRAKRAKVEVIETLGPSRLTKRRHRGKANVSGGY